MSDRPVILVTGGRRVRRNGSQPPALWRDLVAMLEKHGPCTIRHGDCPHPRRDPTRASIDQLAAEFALQLGHVPQPFPADWSRPSGGPERNQRMVDTEPQPIGCLAYPDDAFVGTRDCARRAHAAGIVVVVRNPPAHWTPL